MSTPPLTAPRAPSPTGAGWQWRMLLAAPHRLAFFLAMLVLMASGLWWALLQGERLGGMLGLGYVLSPSVVHASLMVFGFMPIFFAGFLFTAGPKWLDVPAPTASEVRPPLLLQALGWLSWPIASHLNEIAAVAALGLAWLGLCWMTLRFWGLVRASRVPDRIHARAIATALALGCTCLLGVGLAVASDEPDLARSLAQTGLWACMAMVYVSVAHRMIPFFTSSALPMVRAWRPFWVLGLLLSVASFEALAVLVDLFTEAPAWLAVRGVLEIGAAVMVLWLAVAWGLVQSLKVRLVAMLHIGFSWLGVGLGLMGASHAVEAFTGAPWWPLAGLHAVTMGCLGSLMVAMVTRVSCGHSGRPLVADNAVWAMFCILQLATLLRIFAAAPGEATGWLTAAAALAWAAVTTAWALRYGNWYGRQRADGRPG